MENNRRKLTTHFGLQSLKGLGLEQRPASIAVAGAILNYLELTSHTELGHITTLRSIDRLSYMRLDSFTLRSLEILAPMNREEGKSLLDIIDRTETAKGGRLLRHWLSFPLLVSSATSCEGTSFVAPSPNSFSASVTSSA